jgi:hypothetical protein
MGLVAFLTWCRKYHDLVAAAAIVLATTVAYHGGKAIGHSRAHDEDAAESARALQTAEATYRAREDQHGKEIAELRRNYAETKATAAAVDADVTRDLSSGVKRLRLPIASRCPNAPKAGPAAARVDEGETAELTQEAATSLYRIAADGDEAIEQLAALQEWARGAVRLCNGGKK